MAAENGKNWNEADSEASKQLPIVLNGSQKGPRLYGAATFGHQNSQLALTPCSWAP